MMATARLGVEFADQLPAGVEIDDVVVAEFFALKLLGGGDAFAAAVGVEGGALVGVFAVAEGLGEGVDDADGGRQDFVAGRRRGRWGLGDGFEGGGDGGVVGGGGGEGALARRQRVSRVRQPELAASSSVRLG